MKQNFYFKFVFLSLLMMVMGLGNAFAEDTWVKTDPADLKTGDVVVIADLTSSRAMSNDKGTSAAPTAVKLTLSSDKTQITSTVDDNIQWTFKRTDEGYLQFYATETTWLYSNNTNNGVLVGSSKQYMNYTINSGFLYQISNYRYIGYSSGTNDWRCYTSINDNIKNNEIAFFKKVSDDAVLSSISISGYTTTFNVGDEFTFGGTVTATYDKGETKDVTNSASFSGYDMSTPGTQTVTVSYGEKTATYDITVSAVPVTGISLNTNEAEIEVGQTLQLTATIQPENATNKGYSWSSSDESVATVNENGLVSALAAGPVTITVTTTEGGKTATCAVTVKAKEGIWYSLVTSTDDLAEGDKVIIVNTDNKRAMSTTQDTNNRKATDVNITGGKAFVPKNGSIQVLTLEGNNSDGWYFYTGSGYLYAASSSANHLKTKSEIDNNAKAGITISNGATSVVFQGSNTRNVLQNNGQIFSCYASASQSPVDIYKIDDGKQDADLSFSEKTILVNVGETDAFVSPTFNNPNNLTVTATSTNENVASFDVETSKIVLNGSVGTAEITVTSVATDEYRAGVASIIVTVKKAETAVSFAEPVVEITYGDNYDKQKATAEGFSGNLVYTSSNESVVKFHGNGVIDVLGPGTVTITATAPATETTEESSANYTLKIYEPADAVVGVTEVLNEDFFVCNGTNTNWGGSSGFVNVPTELGWETSYCQAGPQYLKLGDSSNAGVATSPAFSVVGEAPLSFALAPWIANNNTENATVTVSLTNATFENGSSSIELSTKDLVQREFTTFDQYKIVGNSEAVQITFTSGGSSQFFLDNVVVGGGAQPAHEINLTFSSAGYLTWVATADIDFTQTTGVTAYKITEATPKKITMVEVNKVKKGEAVMLKGSGKVQLKRTTDAEAFTDNKMRACTDGSVTGNGVGGVTNTDVYVLGNGKNGLGFYMLKGTLQAGKGYLSVTEEAGNAKQNFIGFEVVTGLDAVEAKNADDAAIYNLQGIRVAHPQKGIYVKNGKKYVK